VRTFPLLAALLLAGCLETATPRGDLDVQASVRAHVQAALDRDVDAMMRFYADDWIDLGGRRRHERVGPGAPRADRRVPGKRRMAPEDGRRVARRRAQLH
jgi:hypothetical protein